MRKSTMPAAPIAELSRRRKPSAIVGTPRSEADPERIGGLLKDVKSELTRIGEEQATRITQQASQIEQLQTRQTDLEQALAGRGFRGGDAPETLGSQLVSSAEFQSVNAKMSGTMRFTIQQAITSVGTSGGGLIRRDTRTDPIALPRRRLTIRDLLNPGRTGSNMVEYARQTTRTNNAAPVSEGAQKPESSYAWERAEAPVRTIAHWVPVSRQAMDDSASLRATIDGELTYGLNLQEEEQLLLGDGTGQNLEGLVTAATAFSAPFVSSADTDIDVILQAIAQLGAPGSEIEATGVILNSLDWRRMTGLKDGEGRYLAGGPFGSTSPRAWELPVVACNSMPEGEFLVGDFRRAATIYDRMEVEILISSEDRDNFVKNMLTVRAEERLALAITMPSAMVHGELSTASS